MKKRFNYAQLLVL